MHFSVWSREKQTDEFQEVVSMNIEFMGGPKSVDIVQRGLNEAQLRAVSREIEQLMDQLPLIRRVRTGDATPDEAYAPAKATGNAILKGLGFPPLP